MKILVLAPHADDAEMGCGGSIARFLDEGNEVYYGVFSLCDKSLPDECPPGTLRGELLDASSVLGVPEENINVYDYPVRYHPENRQDILEDLVDLKRKLDPDMVFVPSSTDVHQDHHTVYTESLRAFKDTNLLGYECVWNNFALEINGFIHLEDKYMDLKVESVGEYESQKGRHYADEEFLRHLARVRGAQIGVRYAEAFELIRWIM